MDDKDHKSLETLGSNLMVPSVKELVKGPQTMVVDRYIRVDKDPPSIIGFHHMDHHMEIPVLDMQRLSVLGDSSETSAELHKLHNACKDWGFFQLMNHGVDSSLVEKAKHEIKNLFELPMEEKKKLWQEPGDLSGFGQHFVMSEDQKLDWADLFYMVTLPPSLRKQKLYAMLPASFRETMEEYYRELTELNMKILNAISKALNMDAVDMRNPFEGGMQSTRINYYPPCPQPDHVIGLSPHSDAGGLTILLQANEVEGLQIKKDGMWIPVKPFPDAFVINFGDMIEILSNGIYRSIEHRATVNSEKERLSVATFNFPNLDGDIGPAPSLITPHSPAKFKRIGVADYLKGFFKRELIGKSYLDTMRIPSDN